MADDEPVILVVRGLGAATVSVGALSLASESDVLFMLALVLAQRAGERVSRASLRALIWPGASEQSARHTLRQALYRLHKAGLVTADRAEDISLDPALVDSDLTRVLAVDWPEQAEPRDIELAATVLPGVSPHEHGAAAEFIDSLRSRVAAQYRRAVLRRIAAVKREGRWREVDHWALMCLQADSLNEEATLARAEAAAMVGAKNEAMDILDAYLAELGDREKMIGLPARMLRKRVSELTDTSQRRVQATSVPFVGRHDLLADVQDGLAAARRGESTALWLVGPPGIGKSRLLREVERGAKMSGGTVVFADARPSYPERPFALLTGILPAVLDAPGALGAEPHALSLMRQLGRAETNEEPLPPEEARSRQHAIYLSWVDLMDAVLAEGSLVLILDDVQWCDFTTLAALSRYLESRPKARLGVVLATRRLPVVETASAAHVLAATQLRIRPLTEENVRDFTLAAGLGSDADFERTTQRLGGASGGNPLFLSHLLHHHWARAEASALPPDLSSLMDAQLRLLSSAALRVLQVCSLLGQHSTLSRIERVLVVTAAELVTPFSELDDLLVLPTDTAAPMAPHDLWAERIRAGMRAGVFRALAVSVARVLEADAAHDGSIEFHWDAAKLYRESGEKKLAYATMMRCAEYLGRTGAFPEANRAYMIAAEYADSPRAAFDALTGRVGTLQALEEWDDILTSVLEIRALDIPISIETDAALELTAFSARWSLSAGDTSILSRLREIVTSPRLSARSRLDAAVLGMAASDNAFDAGGVRWFADSISDIDIQSPHERYRKLQIGVVLETAVGDLVRAEDFAVELIAVARTMNDDSALQVALKYASYPPRRAGSLALATSRLFEAGEHARRRQQSHSLATINDMLAGVFLDYGRIDDATAHLDIAESYYRPTLGTFRARSASYTKMFLLATTGRWHDARDLAQLPRDILAHGTCRAQFFGVAAALLVATHFDERAVALECLTHIDSVHDRLFRHSGPDSIAVAYAGAIDRFRGRAEASTFAHWYLNTARRDRLPPPQCLLDLSAS